MINHGFAEVFGKTVEKKISTMSLSHQQLLAGMLLVNLCFRRRLSHCSRYRLPWSVVASPGVVQGLETVI